MSRGHGRPATSDELACVVLSLCNEAGLVEAVRSLVGQSDGCEIVVVNSGGGDPAARLGEAGLEVALVDWSERLFPGAVRNLGIQATRARYVAFLAADCIAEPGWVSARLREHRAGAAAVGGVLTNAFPSSRSACAAFLFLHHRRMVDTPPRERLLYGLSYDRRLFARFGPFREDLRAGEDTEFNARFHAAVQVAWTPDVRTAHRNPTRPAALLRDLYRRGRRQAAMRRRLRGTPQSATVALSALRNVAACLRQARRTAEPAERRRLLRAAPLVVPGALAYAAGAFALRWIPRDL